MFEVNQAQASARSSKAKRQNMETFLIVRDLSAGLILRLLAIGYGIHHDSYNDVKYTDIDYRVYTDAASYVVQGKSPYQRETYRYTPVLAWLLTPNITSSWESYGKILFSLFDVLACYLIYLIVLHENGNDRVLARRCTYLWIFNPLPIVICSRGSSESIILCLVLAVLYLFLKETYMLCGLVYGFAVHFKIYPVTYCLPLYLCLGDVNCQDSRGNLSSLKAFSVSLLKDLLTFTQSRIILVVSSAVGFFLPTILCYWLYGDEFLEETYFYHITRKDIRHNFSLYFYLLYLNHEIEGVLGLCLKILSFFPQSFLITLVTTLFTTRKDLVFVMFIQTYCFVIFNKVCTSQYFLWYLSLIPVLGAKLKIKWIHATILFVIWYFAQISWLLPAYYLEFEGRNTFIYVWLESIAFFCANVGILVQIIKGYSGIIGVNR